jgi:type III secretion protein C
VEYALYVFWGLFLPKYRTDRQLIIMQKFKKMKVAVSGVLCVQTVYYLLFLISMCLLLPLEANAAVVPHFDRKVSLTAREQPVAAFLKELFGQISVPVTVDSELDGLVNGAFSNVSARQVFSEVSRSFGKLAVYYDGAVVHVFTAKDVHQRMLSSPSQVIKSVIGTAQELRMMDEVNKLRPLRAGGLVVTGSKRFVEQIEELVFAAQSRLLDQEPSANFEVFYLKYAWAQDVTLTFGGRQVVVPGVASILRSLIEDGPRLTSQSVSSDTLKRPTQASLRGKGLGGVGADGRASVSRQQSKVDGESRSSDERQSFQAQSVRTHEIGRRNRVRINSDPRLNAIIIRDSPEKMARYRTLIDTLDVKPKMLEIEATIIDINISRLRELGINWRWQNGGDEVLFGEGGGADHLLRPNEVVTPSGKGGFVSFVLGDNAKFIARINALESEGAAHVVSRPHVLTLSNVEAVFDTGETFYVRVEGREEVDLFNVSVGTSLRVTPHVFDEEGQSKIKLLIAIEDGQQKGRDAVVDRIPVIENSSINTQALINAGESILIGGLVRESTEDYEYKVPVLGDIPLFGRLFKSKHKRLAKKERLFLISPRLAESSREPIKPEGGMVLNKGEVDDNDPLILYLPTGNYDDTSLQSNNEKFQSEVTQSDVPNNSREHKVNRASWDYLHNYY